MHWLGSSSVGALYKQSGGVEMWRFDGYGQLARLSRTCKTVSDHTQRQQIDCAYHTVGTEMSQ